LEFFFEQEESRVEGPSQVSRGEGEERGGKGAEWLPLPFVWIF